MVVTKTAREPRATIKLPAGKTMLARASPKARDCGFHRHTAGSGTHIVIAEYSGDCDHARANSAPLRQVDK